MNRGLKTRKARDGHALTCGKKKAFLYRYLRFYVYEIPNERRRIILKSLPKQGLLSRGNPKL